MNTKSLYLSLSIFSAFFCNSSFSDSSQPTQAPMSAKEAFSGFYVTGSVGHSSLSAQKNSFFLTNQGRLVSGGKDISSNAFLGSLDIGASQLLGSSYVAVEATIFHDGHRVTSSATSLQPPALPMFFKEGLNRTYGTGLKTKVGYQIGQQSILYGSLGVECSRFVYQWEFYGFEGKSSKVLWSITPGVGVKTALSDRLSLDFNYNYSFYQDFKKTVPIPGASVNMKVATRVSMARIGLSIKL